jgi:8-oxo-dGTP pyrophosphatase MutT (NUDIX family)
MEIKNKELLYEGVKYLVSYSDTDSFDSLDKSKCTQTYGVCFYNDKMIVAGNGHKKTWGLVGGTIEKGETFEETLKREIKEESNMEVLSYFPIGYQKVIDTRDNSEIYQLRYVCSVRPHGPFVADPTGAVTEIKLIDPKDYKQYFDWGEIGERIMERAIELKEKL